jgi:hypothetical protein
MHPMVSEEMVAGAVQLVCLVSTAMAAVMSYLWSLRL